MKKYYLLLGLVIVLTLLIACAANKPSMQFENLTIEEELSLGKSLSQRAFRQFNIVSDNRIQAFFDTLAMDISKNSHWSGLEYRVYIVNSPEINHFSLPGGSIYIYRGVLDLTQNFNEVAFILAHEIAHIANRDGVRLVSEKYGYALAAQIIVGENPEIAFNIMANLFTKESILDYGDDVENKADIAALSYMTKTGCEANYSLDLMDKIYAAEESFLDSVEKLGKTHPAAGARYKNIEEHLLNMMPSFKPMNMQNEYDRAKLLLNRIPRLR